jgi:hypothetical protein
VHPLIEFIVRNPGLAERLLAEHVQDGSGRCRVCADSVATGRRTWPCQLYQYARAAQRVAAVSAA